MNITIGGMGNAGATMQSAQISGIAKEKSENEKTGVKPQQQDYTNMSIQGDTLQISEAGKSAEANMQSGNQQTGAETGQAGTDTTSQSAAIVSESVDTTDTSTEQTTGKMAIANFQTTDEETDSSDSTDLSSYSESELKEMYSKGEITKAEYSAEISRREQEKAATAGTDATSDAKLLDKMTQTQE